MNLQREYSWTLGNKLDTSPIVLYYMRHKDPFSELLPDGMRSRRKSKIGMRVELFLAVFLNIFYPLFYNPKQLSIDPLVIRPYRASHHIGQLNQIIGFGIDKL